MTDKQLPLLKSIELQGFLSYGPDKMFLQLKALNVLIGPNGSGKSNLVEAISVLRAVPKDLPLPIRQGGGVKDWLWQNGQEKASSAHLEVVFAEGLVSTKAAATVAKTSAKSKSKQAGWSAVRYHLEFGAEGDTFTVLDERIETEQASPGKKQPYLYFGYENGRPMLNVQAEHGEPRELQRAQIDPRQSILSQRRGPETYPELTRLADLLGRMLIYRSWQFGPDSAVRSSCRADVRTDALSESFDNLPARLAELMRVPAMKKRLLQQLNELAPGFDDLQIIPEGGRLQLYLTEGSRSIPAHRLSDGTLRYLCLLAILLDEKPAPLIVIEEPELGLHPDMLPTLRDLMVTASEKTQLVVTTHSTQLVDALTDYADSVLVCEKQDGPSAVRRLTQEEVDRWREHGSLGSLWMSGHIGGTRW
ncbi:MAG: AAA family ATPase [Deltaproteobacteria bacterium]|jgi:predicted ATPase|nr:AAA family ATPase [Deltaproteobacteria bacterium]